jgi:hypothetical protein
VLETIADAMRKIIGWINAVLVSRSRVGFILESVHDGVTKSWIGRLGDSLES